MQRIAIITAALVVLAGAFPTEATQVIAWSSTTLNNLTSMISPGQQSAIVIVIVLIALVSMSRN